MSLSVQTFKHLYFSKTLNSVFFQNYCLPVLSQCSADLGDVYKLA